MSNSQNQQTQGHSVRRIPISELLLDPKNPRLPEDQQDLSQQGLLAYIADTYDAIEIGRSIARYGYFDSEPLIAVRDDGRRYTVVEGNRRLTAVKILADPMLAEGLGEEAEWRKLAESVNLPSGLPVLIVENRESVAPIVGYRHISGIEPWDPYAKARFIASLVKSGKSIEEVAVTVGERATDVAAHFRNHEIVQQAKQQFNLNTKRVERRFGVFTRAMNSAPLRTYIDAPAPSEVDPKQPPLPLENTEQVEKLLSWLFGDDQVGPVISESRDISDLGLVVDSDDGRAELERTRNLQDALITAGGLRVRLMRQLAQARGNLAAAAVDMPSYRDDKEVLDLLHEIQAAIDTLLEDEGIE